MRKLFIIAALLLTSCAATVQGQKGTVYAVNFSPGKYPGEGPWVVYIDYDDGISRQAALRSKPSLKPGDRIVEIWMEDGRLWKLQKIGRTTNYRNSL